MEFFDTIFSGNVTGEATYVRPENGVKTVVTIATCSLLCPSLTETIPILVCSSFGI